MGASDEEVVLHTARSLRWQEPQRAIEILRGFLASNPDARRPMLLLASIYADDYGKGVTGAEELLRRILTTNSKSVSALTGLALLHGRVGAKVDRDESLQLLQRAADLSTDPESRLNLAYKAWDLGRIDQALAAFERLLAIASDQGAAHLAELAKNSINRIRAGMPPRSLHYSWPEAED